MYTFLLFTSYHLLLGYFVNPLLCTHILEPKLPDGTLKPLVPPHIFFFKYFQLSVFISNAGVKSVQIWLKLGSSLLLTDQLLSKIRICIGSDCSLFA